MHVFKIKVKYFPKRGGRTNMQKEAKTGFTAPQSAEIVNKPCQCRHTPGRQTPLQPEKTIN